MLCICRKREGKREIDYRIGLLNLVAGRPRMVCDVHQGQHGNMGVLVRLSIKTQLTEDVQVHRHRSGEAWMTHTTQWQAETRAERQGMQVGQMR